MNYDELSDFEINKLVAEKRGFKVHDFESESSGEVCCTCTGGQSGIFDYRDIEDSWPIIEDNKINIAFAASSDESQASCGFYCCMDKNPRRAAMIVFLMMGD